MPGSLHTPTYKAFLDRLRAARRRSGLTQREAARQLNQPQSYVSKCELGERRVDAMEVVAFARLYGVTLQELLIGPLDDHQEPPVAA
jgi:transcriptional regulator with XRE-family HTH domain